jgi:hypothetical protein
LYKPRIPFLPSIHIEHKRHALAVTVMVVALLIAFPAWHTPTVPGFDDLSRLNVPQRMLIAWFYRHGQFPFWNPFSFGGQPLWAAGQAGPFYLPNIFFLFLPVVAAVKVSYLFHELLAAIGMYGAIWHIRKNRFGAVLSGLAFTTCGFMLGHQIHTQMYDAMSWLPLAFWLFLRLLDNVSVVRMCILAGTIAMEVYAGHPQVTFYLFFTLLLYFALHLLQNLKQPHVFRKTGAVLGSTILGLLLSAAQWLPTLDFIGYSNRADTSSFFLLQGSMPPAGPLQLLSPFVFGGGYTGTPVSQTSALGFYHNGLFWEFTCYTGLVVLTLACGVVLYAWRKNEAVRNLFIIAIFAFNLSLGDNGILGGVLVHAPGFDLFRIPARYIGITDFCLAGLAGISVSYLLTEVWQEKRKLQRWIGAIAALCVLILILAKLIGPLRTTPPMSFWAPLILAVLVAIASFVHVINVRRFYGVYIGGLAILDCVMQSGAFSTYILVSKPEYANPSPVVTYVQSHLDANDPFARVVALDDSTLSYDKSTAFQIPALNGYDSLEPQWYAQNVNLTWSIGTLLQQPRSVLDALDVQYVITAKYSDLLPRETLGIQEWMHWIPGIPTSCNGLLVHLSPAEMPTDGNLPLCSITLVSGLHHMVQTVSAMDTEVVVHLPSDWPKHASTQVNIQNQSWLTSYKIIDVQYLSGMSPLANEPLDIDKWFGPKGWSRVFTDADETIWANPDLRNSAWLTSNSETPLLQDDAGLVQKESWSPNVQKWNVQNPRTGYLVLSQMFDPNWHVDVDGKTAPVVALGQGFGYILTGVPLSAGHHKVVLRYVPGGLGVGAALSLGSACVWLILVCFGARRRRKQRYIAP